MPAYRFELPDHTTLDAPHGAGPFCVGDRVVVSECREAGDTTTAYRVAGVTHSFYLHRYAEEPVVERQRVLFEKTVDVRLVHVDDEADGIARRRL